MGAIEFVEERGWERVRDLVGECPTEMSYIGKCGFSKVNHKGFVCKEELKRLVESWELVEVHGFEKSKEIVSNAPSDDHFYSWSLGGSGVKDKTVNIGELRKAINLVEQCQ